MTLEECFICNKHKKLNDFTGVVLAETGGLILSHFPRLEDEATTRGHLLIEPKRHITDLTEMNDCEAQSLGPLIKLATDCLKSTLKAEHIYLFRLNDKVAHLHFHLVPRYLGTPREYWGMKINEWPDRQKISLTEIKSLSLELQNHIART